MTPSKQDFDAELDLLMKYEGMVDKQYPTINDIDDKAAYTGRLIAILGGIILTAVSVGISAEAIKLEDATTIFFVLLGIGVTSLFVSFTLTMITYLSTTLEYGPTPDLGGYMADYSIDDQQDIDMMLRSYSSGIKANRRAIFGLV